MNYKIKAIGSKKANYMTCGLERMDEGAADLITRMEGAIVKLDVDEKFVGDCGRTAFIDVGTSRIAVTTVHRPTPDQYITIALSPAKDDMGEPLIAIRIDRKHFVHLRETLDDAQKHFDEMVTARAKLPTPVED